MAASLNTIFWLTVGDPSWCYGLPRTSYIGREVLVEMHSLKKKAPLDANVRISSV